MEVSRPPSPCTVPETGEGERRSTLVIFTAPNHSRPSSRCLSAYPSLLWQRFTSSRHP